MVYLYEFLYSMSKYGYQCAVDSRCKNYRCKEYSQQNNFRHALFYHEYKEHRIIGTYSPSYKVFLIARVHCDYTLRATL